MPDRNRVVRPGARAGTVLAADDSVLTIPAGWVLLPPGDPGLTRRVKAAGPTHATPVGSGTVARTQRIPVAERAQAATIAWLRHATTGYDDMVIPRVKGMRREVRRMLAERSRKLLERYRRGESISREQCLLRKALAARSASR